MTRGVVRFSLPGEAVVRSSSCGMVDIELSLIENVTDLLAVRRAVLADVSARAVSKMTVVAGRNIARVIDVLVTEPDVYLKK